MKVKYILIFLVITAVSAAVAVGALAYQSASAAAPQSAQLQDDTTPQGRVSGKGGQADQYLADALGITLDELTAAYQAANQAALDQAVADGLITQAQADELAARGTAFPFGKRWGGWLSRSGIDYEALLAAELNISVEELQAARQEAHNARVDQAVADGRLTAEQADLLKGEYALRNNSDFRSAMQSAFEAAVREAVESGVITQAQADQILARQQERGLGGFGLGGGRGGHGRFGGGRFGGGRGLPGGTAPDSTTPPTQTPSGGL